MAGHINLVKLCVGAETLEDLERWQADPRSRNGAGEIVHVTAMWPRRAEEIVAGGSIYWVIKGQILARQHITRLDPVPGADGRTRCALVLDRNLHRTRPARRKPFQGWRYLAAGDAPPDLPRGADDEADLPAGLADALAELGVL